MATRGQVLQLYKTMLREAGKFPDFNFRFIDFILKFLLRDIIILSFRSYALRRVRDGFKSGKSLEQSDAITTHVLEAERNLQVIKRQVS